MILMTPTGGILFEQPSKKLQMGRGWWLTLHQAIVLSDLLWGRAFTNLGKKCSEKFGR